jgi:hypothetical protein
VKRLPLVVFVGLVLSTVAAFFIIQHLKVATPLIAGNPLPFPSAINPVTGGICSVRTPQGDVRPVDFRRMSVSFFLLHRSDDVDVYMVNESGMIVATLGSGVFMRGLPNPVTKVFTWGGREDSGRLAPLGMYYVKVVLRHQGRTIDITNSKGLLEWVKLRLSSPCPRS